MHRGDKRQWSYMACPRRQRTALARNRTGNPWIARRSIAIWPQCSHYEYISALYDHRSVFFISSSHSILSPFFSGFWHNLGHFKKVTKFYSDQVCKLFKRRHQNLQTTNYIVIINWQDLLHFIQFWKIVHSFDTRVIKPYLCSVSNSSNFCLYSFYWIYVTIMLMILFYGILIAF